MLKCKLSEEKSVCQENMSEGHIFIGNSVLPDRIYCLPQEQMSPCKISHCVISTVPNTAMEFTNLTFTMSSNLKSVVKLRMIRLQCTSSIYALQILRVPARVRNQITFNISVYLFKI